MADMQPVPIMVGCFFAPESPWWQVRRGKLDDARRTIKRLNHRATPDQVTASLALMMHTNAMEKAVSEGTQYWDCFRGVDLRRTEVAAITWLVQNISGSGEFSSRMAIYSGAPNLGSDFYRVFTNRERLLLQFEGTKAEI